MAPAYGITARGTGASLYVTSGAASTNLIWSGTISSGSTIYYTDVDNYGYYGDSREYMEKKDGKLVVPKGKDLLLPDGSVLRVDDMGNYSLDDANAKVVYQANRMREFNPYVNASDLLASVHSLPGRARIESRRRGGSSPSCCSSTGSSSKAANQDGDPIPADIVPPEMHPLFRQRIAALVA